MAEDLMHNGPGSRRALAVLVAIVFMGCSQGAIADNTEDAGSLIRALIPTVAYASTFYLDDQPGRTQFYKSFAGNLAVTFALKNLIDKQRPNGGDQSFPSGHTSVAFQGAAFIHRRYGLKYALPAYLGATFVAYSRVESDQHYVEDVVAGAALGVLSSFYFARPRHGVTVTPVVANGRYGLSISAAW